MYVYMYVFDDIYIIIIYINIQLLPPPLTIFLNESLLCMYVRMYIYVCIFMYVQCMYVFIYVYVCVYFCLSVRPMMK